MKPKTPPVIDVIRQLEIGQDTAFGPYVVSCMINTRHNTQYTIECAAIRLKRTSSPVVAAHFVNEHWSRFYGTK